MALSSVLGLILGLILFALFFKIVYRGGFLKLSLKRERWFEKGLTGLWAVVVPILGLSIGLLMGTYWAGAVLIKAEKLGSKIGHVVFKSVAAGAIACTTEDSEEGQAALTKLYLEGEKKVEVGSMSSHRFAEVTSEQLASLPKDGMFHDGMIWMVEKCCDHIIYGTNGEAGDSFYKLIKKVDEHDRETDNDGWVTVEEIADVACELYLDKGAVKLWKGLILEFLLPVLFTLLGVIFVPPLLAWSCRFFVAYRKRKADQEVDTESTEV